MISLPTPSGIALNERSPAGACLSNAHWEKVQQESGDRDPARVHGRRIPHSPLALVGLCLLSLGACTGSGPNPSTSSGPGQPANIAYPDHTPRLLVSLPMQSSAPTFDGQVDTWSVVPALPTGITIDPSTGTMDGTPLTTSIATDYIVTASGPAGSSTVTLSIRVHDAPRFVFNGGPLDNSLSTCAVDAFDGDLSYGPVQGLTGPMPGAQHIVFHPNQLFAFIPNAGLQGQPSSLSTYAIDPQSGTLEHRSEATCGEAPRFLALSPDGTNVYAVSHDDNRVYSYAVNGATGQLTYLSDQLTNTGPTRIRVDPGGRFVYVLHDQSSDITVFPVDPASGAANPLTQAINYWGTTPTDIVFTSSGARAYISFSNDNRLYVYDVDPVDGTLVATADLPLPGGPVSMALSAYDDFLYVACEDEDILAVLELDPATGLLVQTTTVPAGDGPLWVTIDESGLFAFVLNGLDKTLQPFLVDPDSGQVSAGQSMRTRPSATFIGIYTGQTPSAPSMEYVYALGQQSKDLTGFQFNENTGTLAPITVESLGVSLPVGMAVDPLGRFVFVALDNNPEIAVFRITADTGLLLENLLRTPLSSPPGGIAVDAGGQHLFVTLTGFDQVLSFSIDALSGELTPRAVAATGSGPGAVQTDPTGRFLYVANRGGSSHTLSAYNIQQGLFAAGPTFVPAPGSPGQPRFSPTGERLYVALRGSNLLVPYSVDPIMGSLTLEAGGSSAAIGLPTVFQPHTTGRFGYASIPAANGGYGQIGHYAIAPDGSLQLLQSSAGGQAPIDLCVGPGGEFLLVLNAGSDDLDVFTIQSTTSQLNPQGTYGVGEGPIALGYSMRW